MKNKKLAAAVLAFALAAASCGSVAEEKNEDPSSSPKTTELTSVADRHPETTTAETAASKADTTTSKARTTTKKAETSVSEKTEPTVTTSAAKPDDADLTPYTDVTPFMTNDEFTNTVTQYTCDLYRQTALMNAGSGEGALAGKNDLVSGLSAMLAFGMTANGMAGETLDQLLGTMNGISLETLNSECSSLMDKTDTDNSVINIANGIWINSSNDMAEVKQSFLDACSSTFRSSAAFKPFDDGTKDEINSWVNEQTHGMIPKILENFDDGQLMSLINCICFEDTWADQFEDHQLSDGIFHAADGSEQPCTMLCGNSNGYFNNEFAEGFTKSYSNRDYYFAAMLPKEGVSVEQAINSLSAESVSDFLYRCDRCVEVIFKIPEFTYDYSSSLTDAMKALGCTKAFDSVMGGDFSNMAEYDPAVIVYISSALQKTHIEFDRYGTKAAAATAVNVATGVSAIPKSKVMIFDRPFLYMIVHKTENGDYPVFIGTVNEI